MTTTTCPRCQRTVPVKARFCDGCGSPVLDPRRRSSDPLLGTILGGRFKVEAPVGEGGMGTVYLGRDQLSGREVAVKVLNRNALRNDEVTARFQQEARLLFNLKHPSIVDFLAFLKTPDGIPYLFMEFVRGPNLRRIVTDAGPLPEDRIRQVSLALLDGLHYLHTLPSPVLHRDVKHDNVVFVGGDQVKLMDFGIAKCEGSAKLTQDGTTVGTPEFMSPEQIRGRKNLDQATDQYAFGVTLYYMACGRVPFEQETDLGMEVLQAHLNKEPMDPKKLRPEIQDYIAHAIRRSLSKDSLDRFPSCFAMKRFIESRGEEGIT